MNDKPIITPGTPGAARVEYYACREDVEAMLAKGYNAKNAYDAMKEQGRVTCSYSAFCDYVRGGGVRQHSKKKKSRPRPALQTPPARTPETPTRTFQKTGKSAFDISTVDISKLI